MALKVVCLGIPGEMSTFLCSRCRLVSWIFAKYRTYLIRICI